MAAMYWAECGSTGSEAIGVFQTLSGGNISQPGAPGRALAPAMPGLTAAKAVTAPFAINAAAAPATTIWKPLRAAGFGLVRQRQIATIFLPLGQRAARVEPPAQ